MSKIKTWNDNERDAFSYFQWFNKDEALKRVGIIPTLSVYSINASGLFESGDKTDFIDLCCIEINRIFLEQKFANGYKLYVVVNVEIKDKNSRIEKHKKVWKLLQTKWQLDSFNKGAEVEMEVEGKFFFSSIADFRVENLSTALEIVSSNPKRYAIIASKKDEILSEKLITNIFELAFNQDSKHMDEIDYFGLSIQLCSEGDVVFRWGDSSEEVEIAMIYNPDTLPMLGR